MATLEISNGTLKLKDLPVPETDEWLVRFIKSLFSGGKKPTSDRTFALSSFQSVAKEPRETPASVEWFLKNGTKSRRYITLQLETLNGAKRVISSYDLQTMERAFLDIETAMESREKPFTTSITIENSTIVNDSVVGGNVSNNADEGGKGEDAERSSKKAK